MSFEPQSLKSNSRVLFSSDARKKLYAGLSIAAEAVSCTLGPNGKTVLIQNGNDSPIITKDGVTVSKSIRLDDPVEMMGVRLLREAASQTNDTAGDGTTTSTVLTHALVKNGLNLLEAGYNAKKLVEGMDIAIRLVTDAVVSQAHPVETAEEIAQIGTISANGDKKIGELISAAMEKVGRDGIITVEDAKGMATTLDVVDGMQFDRGYLSPYFVTNNEKMHASYNDAYVLVTDKKISALKDLIPILEAVVNSRKPLLIIADDVDGEALQGLVLNRVKSQLPVVAIKSPGFGTSKDEYIIDISKLTGAKLISSSTGLSLDKVKLTDLGIAKKFVVDAKTTTIVGPSSAREQVQEHVSDLKERLSDVTISSLEMNNLRTRIARLASGVAVVRVGGATEMEMIERKYRIEDALHATRAATEEGIIPGGGTALYTASIAARKATKNVSYERDVLAGIEMVFKSCVEPLRRIAHNSGKSPDVIEECMSKNVNSNFGYDASSGEFVDLVAAGIIDPVKVTKMALKNSSSVARLFLTLDAVLVNGETA
jgi:chaperonin GroEL